MFNYTSAEMVRRCTPGVRATQATCQALAEARGAFRERRLNPERLPRWWRPVRSLALVWLSTGYSADQVRAYLEGVSHDV